MNCELSAKEIRVDVNGNLSNQYRRLNSIYPDAEVAYEMYKRSKFADNLISESGYNMPTDERTRNVVRDENGEMVVYFAKADTLNKDFLETGRTILYKSKFPKDEVLTPVVVMPDVAIQSDSRNYSGKDIHITKDGVLIAFNRSTIVPIDINVRNVDEVNVLPSNDNRLTRNFNLLSTIERNIKKTLPGIRINYFNGKDNHYVKNGEVFINTDKLNTNSYVHELSHLFTMVWKNSNIESFNEFISTIEEELKDTSYYKELRSRYSDYNDDDFRMELIADMMESYTMDKFFTKDIPLTLKAGVVRMVKQLIEKITRAFNNLFGIPVIKTFDGMTFSQLEETFFKVMNGELSASFTSNEINSMNYFKVYEKRDVAGPGVKQINSSKNLFEALIMDEQVMEEMPIDRQVEMFYSRVKKYGQIYGVIVNGKQLTFDTNEPTFIKNAIKEQLQKGRRESDSIVKKTIVETTKLFGSERNANVKLLIKRFEALGYKFSESTMRELHDIINTNVGSSVVRLSELQQELTKMGFKFNEDLSGSLLGFDPLVTIEFVVNSNGKRIPIVSLYDITPESLRYHDSIVGPGHILKRFDKTSITGLTMRNNKEDVRKLMLGMVANKLSRAGINVNRSMVIGLYANEYNKDTIRTALVDQVEVNRNLAVMNRNEAFSGYVGEGIKKEFDPANHVDKSMAFTDALVSYWKNNADEFYDYGIETNDIREHKTDLARLIKLRMRSYEKGNPRISEYEYRLMANVLIELNKLPSVNGQFNYKAHLTAISKLIKPAYGIGNDVIQAVRARIQNVSNNLVNKVKQWDEVFENIYKAYREQYPVSAKEYVKAQGSKIFEKSFATVKAKDDLGNEHEVRINYLLWTTDKRESPLFAEQAEKIDKKILEANRIIVEKIYELMVDVIYHERISNIGYNKTGGGKYTRKDAEDYLNNTLGYKKGYIPIISKTVGEMVGASSVSDIINGYINRQRNAEQIYENASNDELLENLQQELSFQLVDAMKSGVNGMYGSSKMLSKIGMKYDMVTGELTVVDRNLNNMMSTNLELITKYTVLSANRKIAMESEVVPLANAAMQVLREEQGYGIQNKEEIDYLKMVIEGKIYNRSRMTSGKILGQNVEPVIAASMKIIGTTALALNINVAATSLIWNTSNMVAEGIANSFSSLLGMDNTDFTLKDVNKAAGLLITDTKRLLAIAHKMNMINESEVDIVNHWVNVKTKKSLINEHIAHIGNWATDIVGKTICMAAQLNHNGSLDAYSIDSKGNLVYDETKDKYFEGKEGQLIKQHIKKQLVESGMMASENDKMPFGLDFYSIRKIRAVVSKWIIGPYETNERAMMNHYILGRMFSQFKQFMYSRVDNAFASGEYIEDIGSWKVVKDADGKEMVAWEKRFCEGYMISLLNSVKEVYKYLRTGKKVELNDVQKQNILRAASKVAVFLTLYMLYNGLTDEDDDDDDIGVIGERRFLKNIKFAYQEFLIVSPQLWVRTVSNPFALTSIIGRAFDDRFSSSPFNNFAKVLLPGYTTVTTTSEMFKSDETIKAERKEKIRKGIKKKKEEEAEKNGMEE